MHRELGFIFIGTIVASTCTVGVQLHSFSPVIKGFIWVERYHAVIVPGSVQGEESPLQTACLPDAASNIMWMSCDYHVKYHIQFFITVVVPICAVSVSC